MEIQENNPQNNSLGSGVTEEALRQAIETSGYPLQSMVIDGIVKGLGENRWYWVQEEWPWIDQDEGTVRQLDGVVSCEIVAQGESGEDGLPIEVSGFLRQRADLLIECKQSELPFVFFLRDSRVRNAPRIAGAPHQRIEIDGRFDDGSLALDLDDILNLNGLPFSQDAPTAVSMTRVYRKGNSLVLSGEESFRGLALPLLKATQHYIEITKPKSSFLYHDVRSVFPVAVLRAPIVGVRMVDGSPEMMMLPWVRVVWTEPRAADRIGRERSETISFDVIHFDFLDSYISRVLSTAEEIAHRISRIAMPIITGAAYAPPEEPNKDSSEAAQDEEAAMWELLQPPASRAEFNAWILKPSATSNASSDDEVDTEYSTVPDDSEGAEAS